MSVDTSPSSQHIHILGICGTFMGSLAVLAKQAGFKVTGCDTQVYPPMSDQLRAQGIELIEGYDATQTQLQPDIFIIGNVVSRGNALIEAILDQGLLYMSGPQWLGEHILQHKWVLAVAGTHGKTTTSSLLTWILEDAGYHPGYLIGGVPQNFSVSARLGQGEFFVIEADEYDTAFFDKRSKFLHYRPKTLVINNMEFDHADIFADLAAIQTQFHHVVRTVPAQGRIIAHTMPSVRNTLDKGLWSPVLYFNDEQDWHTGAPKNAQASFGVYHQNSHQADVTWQMLGAHNQQNALAAILAAHHVGVPIAHACASLSTFIGIRRRMELRGCISHISVYDDFAHHPSAIATTLDGLHKKIQSLPKNEQGRIFAVLEPRSNTMKMGAIKAQLPESLALADEAFIYGASTGKDAIGWNMHEVFTQSNMHVYDDLHRLIEDVISKAQAHDHIVVMSNGAFGGIHQKMLDILQVLAVS